ncbi:hypothetical protein [Citrobacter sp. RHBSTW-00986]|uniref:hypothetical protein n=1 Tax=Citrobacter sp. RHBSTW-00986 TaxID=2742675 RepID=UPI002104EE26|nr:hypothetical protein [Citrobacter sp. RHBSTW-00986]
MNHLATLTDSSSKCELSCIRNGTNQNSLYNPQQLATTPQNVQEIATVKMHYLNEQKNMAILNIEYK